MLYKKKPGQAIPLRSADRKLMLLQLFLKIVSRGKLRVNSFKPAAKPQTIVREDGIVFHNDLNYGSRYPNSFLDVWTKADTTKKRPTVLYFHGGGFFMGSKSTGDPLAVKTADNLSFIGELLNHSYNVINIDYALSPKYRFPVQLEQVDEACRFLIDNQGNLGLDMNRLFFMGGSAGADLSEIYGLVVADREYAEKLGIHAVVDPRQICGLIIDEAALSVKTFMNKNMNTMLESWLGEDDIENGRYTNLIDAPKHIKDHYFPSYIVASNKEHFFKDHGDELAAVLARIQVPYD